MDVDTRLLRYFDAVAADGNLTRAAERLFVSQPALTKQIRQLESQLGVRLFTRSRAGMTLTAAGQALADATPAVLAGWDQALRETKAAASRAARVLRVGFMSSAANEATQQIIAAFARRRLGWRVDMQQAAWSDPTAGLASGHVDAALLRLPFPGQERRADRGSAYRAPLGRAPRHAPARRARPDLLQRPVGRAVRRRPRGNQLVARLLAGHRRTPGSPGPHRSRHRPARYLADRDRQRRRHRLGPRIRRPLLRTPRHHLPARHRRQPQPSRRRLAARQRHQPRRPGLRPLLPGQQTATTPQQPTRAAITTMESCPPHGSIRMSCGTRQSALCLISRQRWVTPRRRADALAKRRRVTLRDERPSFLSSWNRRSGWLFDHEPEPFCGADQDDLRASIRLGGTGAYCEGRAGGAGREPGR